MSYIERPFRALATRSTGMSANDMYLNLTEHPQVPDCCRGSRNRSALVGGTGSATSHRVDHNLGDFSSRCGGLCHPRRPDYSAGECELSVALPSGWESELRCLWRTHTAAAFGVVSGPG